MTAPDLKPCPFCGREAELNDCLVECRFCLCTVPDGFGYEGGRLGYATEAEAIAAWNTRAVDHATIREAALREAAAVAWVYGFEKGDAVQKRILALIGEKK